MGMHFKLGLYEHQSAGALVINLYIYHLKEGLIKLMYEHKFVEYKNIDVIENINVVAY